MTTEELINTVRDFHGDTSRSPAETLEGLKEVAGEVDAMIEALEIEVDE